MIGGDHVRPWSVERITATEVGELGLLAIVIRSNTTTSVPSGSTTRTLPIVCASTPGSKIARAGSHAPAVERASQVGPVPSGLVGCDRPVNRSHTR